MKTCSGYRLHMGFAIVAFIAVSALVCSEKLEANPVPQEVFVHFRGVTEQENALDLIKSGEGPADPFVYRLVMPSEENPVLPWTTYVKTQPFTSTTIIFDLILRYPEETQRQQRLGHNPYPGESPYSPETIKIMERAAARIAQLLGEFHRDYPDVEIKAISIGIGGEVLLRTLKGLDFKLDKLIFYYPPLSAVKGPQFRDTLNQGGYQHDNAVSVIALEEDPTIPYLEKLKDENGDLFRLFVMPPGGQ